MHTPFVRARAQRTAQVTDALPFAHGLEEFGPGAVGDDDEEVSLRLSRYQVAFTVVCSPRSILHRNYCAELAAELGQTRKSKT
jgi:hypothetical protein